MHNNFLFYFISNFIRRKSISYLGTMKWFIVYLLYYDFFYYFMHRLLHTRYFYPIHKIHHQKYNPDYHDFYNVQVIEVPLTSVGLFVAMYLHKIYICARHHGARRKSRIFGRRTSFGTPQIYFLQLWRILDGLYFWHGPPNAQNSKLDVELNK